MNPEPNTTPINGRPVPYTDEVIDIDQLKFWEGNPRVYAAVRGVPGWKEADPVQRQKIIAECMEKQESTRTVLDGLRAQGGQQEPLIVDLRGHFVIEGNSRLAALRILDLENHGQWGAAICRCYNDLTDEELCSLLSEMHVVGKKEWSPYAKAAMYWRHHHDLKWDLKDIARLNRTNVPKVKTELATIELMADQHELNEHKYSWYNVLTSSRAISAVFTRNTEFRKRILTVIKNASPDADDAVERSSTAFRNGLSKLVKKERPLRRFCSGSRTLQEAVEEAQLSTLSAKLGKARSVLNDIDSTDFVSLSHSQRSEASRVFKRLRQDIDRITRFFDEDRKDT